MNHTLLLSGLLLGLSTSAFAQDESLDDFDLDLDLESAPTEQEEIREERASLESDIQVEEQSDDLPPPSKRVIKILQKKNFMKMKRIEGIAHFGGVSNDKYVRRLIVGAGAAYHVTEVFGVELDGGFAPDLGQSDWTGLTQQLVNENQVSPGISKLLAYGTLSMQYSPMYGKIALGRDSIINLDFFGLFGPGIAFTVDDEEANNVEDDIAFLNTQSQAHPTINLGFGARAVFNNTIALRVEVRNQSYIEVINSTSLEMKQLIILQAGVSFFGPQSRK